MKIQDTKLLSSVYSREEAFSSQLAKHIKYLKVGSFDEAETESRVGTRRADIVATGDDGTLVIENQFGKADWDHWGRLEAYARLKEANVAALVAEGFEELMIVTCNLRNEDSKIDWYLILAEVNTHDELAFHHISRPAIDIQTQKGSVEYSEFWEPVRRSGLFAGKPVPVRDEAWIGKGIRGITLCLHLYNHSCAVILYFQGDDRVERRQKALELLLPEKHELRESPKFANILFPVLDKGKKDLDHWDEIRKELVSRGEKTYNLLKNSDV